MPRVSGYNDPIIGQGLSIAFRDVRIVRDLLASGEPWRPKLFAPYAEERRERMRRLRIAARFITNLFARFGDVADERRLRALPRIAADPRLMMLALALFTGTDAMPAEIFTEETVERVFAA